MFQREGAVLGITIGSNIASLNAQGKLGKTSDRLNSISERLSSGQRINRASDDAAGLAISLSLNQDRRIYTQSIKNVDDAISATSIAKGATDNLSDILIRMRELAEQSANGTFSQNQRNVMDSEAQALRNEFNRIVDTTKFNGIKLLSETTGTITIQAGSTAANTQLSLTSSNLQVGKTGNGTFGSVTSFTIATGGLSGSTVGDFNGDGYKDIISGSDSVNSAYIFIGNGDGTFKALTTVSATFSGGYQAVADFNGDGKDDFISTTYFGNNSGAFEVYFGNGDGTFSEVLQGTENSTGSVALLAVVGDFNNDGLSDFATGENGSAGTTVYLSNGNGTFRISTTITNAVAYTMTTGDFNNDGNLDILSSNGSGSQRLMLGNGNGTFRSGSLIYRGFSGAIEQSAVDVNGDGKLDIVTSSGATAIEVSIGNGDGTFNYSVTYQTSGSVAGLTTGDVNGDGINDIVTTTSTNNDVYILIGNGNGTFRSIITLANAGGRDITLSDLNEDGVLDLFSSRTASPSNISVSLGNGNNISTLNLFSIKTQGGAYSAIRTLQTAQDKLLQAVGKIGADESRLNAASANLRSLRLNISQASSRILDSDVAEDAAEYTRLNILQQAGAAILAQANQSPAIALQLLSLR